MRVPIGKLLLPISLFVLGNRVAAQTPAEMPVSVFMDCQASNCDTEHFRVEIGFVNWVRDRTQADVHVLITSQGTGGGGTEYALSFLGLRPPYADTLQLGLSAAQSTTSSERRDLLTNRIAQGLLRYAVRTSAASRVLVRMPDSDGDDGDNRVLAAGMRDPWNHWVFELGVDFSMQGESRESEKDYQLELGASRVTADWKFDFEVDGSYSEERTELSDRTLFVLRREYSADFQLVKALAPLWSAGLQGEVGTSIFRNQDLYTRVAPVLEYSFFPYSDFSRRQVTLRYSVGASRFDYSEVTIFNKLEETVFDEELELDVQYQQPWGSAGMQLSGSHYFHDTSLYNLSADMGIDVRLIRGLSLDVGASYSRVHDQLHIEKDDATDEEILTQRRALQTAYQYNVFVGLNFTFGSVFNNIVNRRLD